MSDHSALTMSTVVRCDRCGATAPEEGIFSRFEPCRATGLMAWPEMLDLCHACSCSLIEWVQTTRARIDSGDPHHARSFAYEPCTYTWPCPESKNHLDHMCSYGRGHLAAHTCQCGQSPSVGAGGEPQ